MTELYHVEFKPKTTGKSWSPEVVKTWKKKKETSHPGTFQEWWYNCDLFIILSVNSDLTSHPEILSANTVIMILIYHQISSSDLTAQMISSDIRRWYQVISWYILIHIIYVDTLCSWRTICYWTWQIIAVHPTKHDDFP